MNRLPLWQVLLQSFVDLDIHFCPDMANLCLTSAKQLFLAKMCLELPFLANRLLVYTSSSSYMWGGQNNEKLFTNYIHFKMLLLLLDIIIHLIRQVVKTMFANLGWGSLGCRFACEGVPGRKKVEDPIQLVYRKNLSTLPHLSFLSPFLKSFYFCSSLSLYPSTP